MSKLNEKRNTTEIVEIKPNSRVRLRQVGAEGVLWIAENGMRVRITKDTLDILGDNNKAYKTISHGDLTDEMIAIIFKNNEKSLVWPVKATKEWVLDQILAKEAKGIDCTIERQMAKQYFNEPEFTPKRALKPAEAAKPQDPWDVPF